MKNKPERPIRKGDRVKFAPDNKVIHVFYGDVEDPWSDFKPGSIYTVRKRKRKGGLYVLKFPQTDVWYDAAAFDLHEQREERESKSFWNGVQKMGFILANWFIQQKLGGGFGGFGGFGRMSGLQGVTRLTGGTDGGAKVAPKLPKGLEYSGQAIRLTGGYEVARHRAIIDGRTRRVVGYMKRPPVKFNSPVTPHKISGVLDFIDQDLPAPQAEAAPDVFTHQNSPNMANELGVEVTVQSMTGLAKIVKSLVGIDANRDGQIDTPEKLNAGSAVAMGLFPMIGNIGDVRAETKRGEFTREEKEEVIERLIALDFLPPGKRNDEVEEWLDDTVRAVLYNERYITNTLAFFRGGSERDEDAPTTAAGQQEEEEEGGFEPSKGPITYSGDLPMVD